MGGERGLLLICFSNDNDKDDDDNGDGTDHNDSVVAVEELGETESPPYRLLVMGGGHRSVITWLQARGGHLHCHHRYISSVDTPLTFTFYYLVEVSKTYGFWPETEV